MGAGPGAVTERPYRVQTPRVPSSCGSCPNGQASKGSISLRSLFPLQPGISAASWLCPSRMGLGIGVLLRCRAQTELPPSFFPSLASPGRLDPLCSELGQSRAIGMSAIVSSFLHKKEIQNYISQ